MTIDTVPAPTSVIDRSDSFSLGDLTRIRASAVLEHIAQLLRAQLAPATGLPLRVEVGGPGGEPGDRIELELDPSLAEEEYRLDVTAAGVRITGGAPTGVLHGTQTFRQLLPPAALRRARGTVPSDGWRIGGVEIADAPAHRWRGLMLDTARHFMSVRDVLRIVDLLALHRFNVLHLHLTDDQGWRIEILRYPRLAEVGGWRASSQTGRGASDGRPHGGFYTQDDIREIVAYAADRGITVVPEIETPGHARAALAAYPQLAVGGLAPDDVWTEWGISEDVFNVEEETIDVLCQVLDEVIDLFPSPMIGIGGDECPKTRWRGDQRTQERMRELGLEDEEQLQAWFVGRLEQHVRSRGRRVFGWDEILEGGAPDAFGRETVVASWRGEVGARLAAERGYDVVACPADRVYLDYRQSEDADEPIPSGMPIGWRDVYAFDPVPSGLTPAQAAHVIGGQGNLWTEHIDSPDRVDYMLFPRLGALAEALWTGPSREIGDFERRLPSYLSRLEALGVGYRRETGPLPWQKRPGVTARTRTREEHAEHIARITANLGD